MKKIMLLLLVVLITGCFSGAEPLTEKKNMKTICLDGVTYYYFRELQGNIGYSYMSVKFNSDSTVNTCKGE